VALVRGSTDTNQEASPFTSELAWVVQWRGNKWWAVGLFSSPWGTRFVVDAAVIGGKVYTYIAYSSRPSAKWVRATARRWQLSALYTRLAPDAAIQLVEKDTISPSRYTILGAAAKLARDSAEHVGWYFAIYVQDRSGTKLVFAVNGLGGGYVEEGDYAGGYGFGATPQLQTRVPLNISDWIRAVAKKNGWSPSNLP
jgi:hypothetical protein